MTVTVSVRGQMVIPSQIRKKHHIQPQTKIELLDKGNEIVIIPLPKDTLQQARGILKGVVAADLLEFRRQEKRLEGKKSKQYGLSS